MRAQPYGRYRRPLHRPLQLYPGESYELPFPVHPNHRWGRHTASAKMAGRRAPSLCRVRCLIKVMSIVTTDLISQALAGNGDAFGKLTEPYRRELQVHCYRMLGSFKDAEDVLQETMLSAWQGLPGFKGNASLRTWLYRI